RFQGLSVLAQLFGQRKKETALRVRLETEPELFNLRVRRWCHRGTRILTVSDANRPACAGRLGKRVLKRASGSCVALQKDGDARVAGIIRCERDGTGARSWSRRRRERDVPG